MKGKQVAVLAEKAVKKQFVKHPPRRPGRSDSGKGHLAEEALQNHLIEHPPGPYKHLAAQEWLVKPGHSDKGKGDLVFKYANNYLVVETKYLPTATGRTACSSRTRKRHKVREQAKTYGEAWKEKHPSARVEMAMYTNINGLEKLGEVKCQKEN